ncbi:MAG: ChaN family lipoprotein [Terriglobales bacterium]
MATITRSRSRQNALQIQGLAAIEPEIRAFDPTWRRKYLQDYHQAFRSYESVLHPAELQTIVSGASLILVGDYHALPACQLFAADLLKARAESGDRPVVLAVETIFSRDQHILDEWWQGNICERELRQRVRFDLDWGYDWDPFYELLSAARLHGHEVFGLDCMPREDLRKIAIRDRHAAHKLAEIRQCHPRATIIALVGESHLAPTHLPALIAKQLPRESVLSILQNVDALYWTASEKEDDVRAVRVNDHTICVFNSTPLEKYESYRRCLERWGKEQYQDQDMDFAPAIYDLIDKLLRFLDINRYSPNNGTQPKSLIDSLPEIYGPSRNRLEKLLARRKASEDESKAIFGQIDRQGCAYLSRFNAFVVREFRIAVAAREASRFVHHACQNFCVAPANNVWQTRGDRAQLNMLEEMLAELGSRILCRPTMKGSSMKHTDGLGFGGERSAEQFTPGALLGAALFREFERGNVSRTDLKRLFLFSVKDSGKAAELCSQLSRRLRSAL